MNHVTRLIVMLAIAVTVALVAVVLFAFAQVSPRSVLLFLALLAVPLGVIVWALRKPPPLASNPAPSLNHGAPPAQDSAAAATDARVNESLAPHAQD